jgi:hypothetical protein
MTPERRAELEAELDAMLGPPPIPKPKVVATDGVVIRDADVVVSPRDKNARYRGSETVAVRRADYVAVNMEAATAEWWNNVQARETQRHLRREADPFGYGHWGPTDE